MGKLYDYYRSLLGSRSLNATTFSPYLRCPGPLRNSGFTCPLRGAGALRAASFSSRGPLSSCNFGPLRLCCRSSLLACGCFGLSLSRSSLAVYFSARRLLRDASALHERVVRVG